MHLKCFQGPVYFLGTSWKKVCRGYEPNMTDFLSEKAHLRFCCQGLKWILLRLEQVEAHKIDRQNETIKLMYQLRSRKAAEMPCMCSNPYPISLCLAIYDSKQ